MEGQLLSLHIAHVKNVLDFLFSSVSSLLKLLSLLMKLGLTIQLMPTLQLTVDADCTAQDDSSF